MSKVIYDQVSLFYKYGLDLTQGYDGLINNKHPNLILILAKLGFQKSVIQKLEKVQV